MHSQGTSHAAGTRTDLNGSHATDTPRTSAPRQAFGGESPYAPAPETARVAIADHYGHYINGKWSKPRATLATINPATEAVLSRVAQGAATDVDAAVSAARAALPKWQALPAVERAKFLFRIARRIQERARELAVLESMDSGKPIKESRDVDVPLAAAHFFYYAGWADKLEYAALGATPLRGVTSHPSLPSKAPRSPAARLGEPAHPTHPRPVGVCGQIIPWNFPLLMAAWKLAPALACGNTCVLKPAETTPLTALRLAEILDEVGLPPGVVNVVTGDGSTGAAIVNHPGVDKIAFTGSTEVGKKIALAIARRSHAPEGRATTQFTARATRLTLELGGKSPHLIFDDAPLDQAIEGIVQGIYFNQGEVCCAGSRLLVQESIVDEVRRKLSLRLATLRVGDPLDKNTDVGAINSKEQLARIDHYLALGQEEGAELCVPGLEAPRSVTAPSRHPLTPSEARAGLPSRGYWCRPCFFANVQPSHAIAREEIFGPVLSLLTFRTVDEAIARANNTPYGLAAGVWTDKGSKALEVATKLKAGVVWCNTYNRFDPASPFGGYKESGFGREGGRQGLAAYLA
jgi:aldehyde dehydrogenase (NAD+)